MRRRYYRARRNLLDLYLPLMDYWTVCDKSGDRLLVLAQRPTDGEVEIVDAERWERFKFEADHEDR